MKDLVKETFDFVRDTQNLPGSNFKNSRDDTLGQMRPDYISMTGLLIRTISLLPKS